MSGPLAGDEEDDAAEDFFLFTTDGIFSYMNI